MYICNFCKLDFTPSRNRKIPPKFCSRKCNTESQKRRVFKECKWCNKTYEIASSADKGKGRSKYCSVECRQKSLAKILKKRKSTTCNMCEKTFEQKPCETKCFCNNKCYRKYASLPNYVKKNKTLNISNFNSFKELSSICAACKKVGGIHIHHCDGDRRNNETYNLIPLCYSCHKTVHAFHDESKKSLKNLTFAFVKFLSKLSFTKH